MTKVEITWATYEHALELAQNIREEDRREVWASHKMEPLPALEKSLIRSNERWTALIDDRVMCIYGVAPKHLLSLDGMVWMLATDMLPKYSRLFLPGSRKWVSNLQGKYDYLFNYVDARNRVALRWLKWLGFKIYPAAPFGALQLPFHKFEWRR